MKHWVVKFNGFSLCHWKDNSFEVELLDGQPYCLWSSVVGMGGGRGGKGGRVLLYHCRLSPSLKWLDGNFHWEMSETIVGKLLVPENLYQCVAWCQHCIPYANYLWQPTSIQFEVIRSPWELLSCFLGNIIYIMNLDGVWFYFLVYTQTDVICEQYNCSMHPGKSLKKTQKSHLFNCPITKS